MIPCGTALRGATGILVLLALSSLGWAQSGRGNVSGTIRDSSGASIPGAQVTVTNTATNEKNTLTTNATGDYTAADVPVGNYTVQASKTGFGPAELKGVTVNSAATARADIMMQVGQSRQMIEVQAAALQVDSEDSQTAVTVNQTLVNELPWLWRERCAALLIWQL